MPGSPVPRFQISVFILSQSELFPVCRGLSRRVPALMSENLVQGLSEVMVISSCPKFQETSFCGEKYALILAFTERSQKCGPLDKQFSYPESWISSKSGILADDSIDTWKYICSCEYLTSDKLRHPEERPSRVPARTAQHITPTPVVNLFKSP